MNPKTKEEVDMIQKRQEQRARDKAAAEVESDRALRARVRAELLNPNSRYISPCYCGVCLTGYLEMRDLRCRDNDVRSLYWWLEKQAL